MRAGAEVTEAAGPEVTGGGPEVADGASVEPATEAMGRPVTPQDRHYADFSIPAKSAY